MTTVSTPTVGPPALGPVRVGTQERIQRVGSIAIVVACWLWMRPLGFSGVDGLALALLVINSAFILARHLPARSWSRRPELIFVVGWGVAAASLLSIRSLGVGASFAYFATGHAGYRLRLNEALVAAV